MTRYALGLILISSCVLSACKGSNNNNSERLNSSSIEGNNLYSDTEELHPAPCGPKTIPIHIVDYGVELYPTKSDSAPHNWETLEFIFSPNDFQSLLTNTFKIRFSLFASAYACQSSRLSSEQTITHFSITSDGIFAPDLDSGAELKQFFNARLETSGEIDLEHYPSESYAYAPTTLRASLKQQPFESRQNFTIRVEFSDGNISETQTGDIFFAVEHE